MANRTKMASIVLAVATFFAAAAGTAGAAEEQATGNLTMNSQSGKLFRDAYRPVNWTATVAMTAPYPDSPLVQPIKRVIADFPEDMTFSPSKKTPVCGDSAIGPPPVNMSVPTDVAIERCPNSVIGNGTTGIYFGKSNSPQGPTLKNVSLVVFNGGFDPQGRPVMKIHGYSEVAQVGTFMVGTLKGNHLEVDVPYLPADSASAEFQLEIPGSASPFPNRRGTDPGYVVAKCSAGTWDTNTSLLVGARDATGRPVGGESTVIAPTSRQTCVGARGKAKFGSLGISGPGKAKPGRSTIYRLKVRNRGTADVKALTLKASGGGVKGKTKIGLIRAESSKVVKLKVRFPRRKTGKVRIRFKAAAGKMSQSARKTVRLTR
ncbi:MAG: hypothetical protein WBW62_01530 [Solirubrobacterales bacterium]